MASSEESDEEKDPLYQMFHLRRPHTAHPTPEPPRTQQVFPERPSTGTRQRNHRLYEPMELPAEMLSRDEIEIIEPERTSKAGSQADLGGQRNLGRATPSRDKPLRPAVVIPPGLYHLKRADSDGQTSTFSGTDTSGAMTSVTWRPSEGGLSYERRTADPNQADTMPQANARPMRISDVDRDQTVSQPPQNISRIRRVSDVSHIPQDFGQAVNQYPQESSRISRVSNASYISKDFGQAVNQYPQESSRISRVSNASYISQDFGQAVNQYPQKSSRISRVSNASYISQDFGQAVNQYPQDSSQIRSDSTVGLALDSDQDARSAQQSSRYTHLSVVGLEDRYRNDPSWFAAGNPPRDNDSSASPSKASEGFELKYEHSDQAKTSPQDNSRPRTGHDFDGTSRVAGRPHEYSWRSDKGIRSLYTEPTSEHLLVAALRNIERPQYVDASSGHTYRSSGGTSSIVSNRQGTRQAYQTDPQLESLVPRQPEPPIPLPPSELARRRVHLPMWKRLLIAREERMATHLPVSTRTSTAASSCNQSSSEGTPSRHFTLNPLNANATLTKEYDEFKYRQHRLAVSNMKKSIDDSSPMMFFHLDLNLKRLQREQFRLMELERENRIMLEKISYIFRTKPAVNTWKNNKYRFKDSNWKEKCQRKFLTVTAENAVTVGRLLTTEPVYKTKQLHSYWRVNQRHIEMKTRYPFKWKGSVPTYVPPKKPQYGYLRTFVTPLRHTPGKLVMRPGRCYVDRYGYLFPMVHPKGPPEFPQPRYTGRTPHPPSNPPKWGDIGFRKMRARAAIQQTVG